MIKRKTASFVSNTILRGRKYVKLTPEMKRQLLKEVANFDRSSSIKDVTQRVIIDAVTRGVEEVLRSKVGSMISGDTAFIPPEMIGSDNSGSTTLISKFKSVRMTGYGPEAVNIKRHKYVVYMNQPTQGKFARVPHGYSTKNRLLVDTKRDFISPKDKLSLISESGFNESLVDILDFQTFFSVWDMHTLTNCDEEIKNYTKQKERQKERSTRSLRGNDNESKSIKKQLALTQLGEIGTDRIYSKVLKLKTRLDIHGDHKSYLTYVKVYLCSHRRFKNCANKESGLTSTELYDGILKDMTKLDSRSIKENSLLGTEKKNKSAKIKSVKKSLTLKPGTNVMNSETIIDNVNIIKTFRFILKPTEIASIVLHNNFPRGIDLFDLNQCELKESSATTFFIVEACGSPNARISHKTYNQIKHNGNAPVQLRYEFQKEVKFISKESEPDIPSVVITEGINRNFEDGELAQIFYPNRKPEVSFPINKLDIGGSNPKAKFTLDLDASTTLTPTLLETAQASQKNGQFLDLEDAMQIKKFVEDTSKSLYESINENHKPFYASDTNFTKFNETNDEPKDDSNNDEVNTDEWEEL